MAGISSDSLTAHVREQLRRRGVGRQELAQILGGSVRHAESRLYGNRRWQGHELVAVAHALGMTVQDLTPTAEDAVA